MIIKYRTMSRAFQLTPGLRGTIGWMNVEHVSSPFYVINRARVLLANHGLWPGEGFAVRVSTTKREASKNAFKLERPTEYFCEHGLLEAFESLLRVPRALYFDVIDER
jgi:hypothetical protein